MTGRRISWRRAAAVVVAVAVGGGVGSAWAAFVATTSNGTNSFSAASPDTTPPTISRAVAAKTDGSTPGTIRQGGSYYVYAQVTDDTSVSTATADTSSFDTGATSASMSSSGGPWTIGGQSYNYRSALLTANTPLSTGSSHSYTVTATDGSGNTAGSSSYSVTIETYAGTISSTAGIVSHWRLGDGSLSADEFTDTAGTAITSHTGAVGASWTEHPGQTQSAVISDQNRVRKAGTGASLYYTSAAPSSANYLVEADMHVKSILADDAAGVLGRHDPGSSSGIGTNYLARYEVDTGQWQLRRHINGTTTSLGSYNQTLTAGQTYRVTLEMNGSTIRLLVDGVQRISVTDTGVTAGGRGGIRLGAGGSTAAVSNTAGLHLDNFRITSLTTTAVDGPGTSDGTYTGGVRLNQPANLTGDSDRAAIFDGSNDYVNVPDAASLRPSSITLEAWVNPNAGIPDYSSVAAKTTLNSWDDGYGMYYWGGNVYFWINDDQTNYARATTVPTGTWTHLVGTYDGATIKIYKNGSLAQSVAYAAPISHSTSPLHIGRAAGTGGWYWPGSLDEVAIYNQALSSATVLDHYNAGKGTG